jgi:hypothetical protein
MRMALLSQLILQLTAWFLGLCLMRNHFNAVIPSWVAVTDISDHSQESEEGKDHACGMGTGSENWCRLFKYSV